MRRSTVEEWLRRLVMTAMAVFSSVTTGCASNETAFAQMPAQRLGPQEQQTRWGIANPDRAITAGAPPISPVAARMVIGEALSVADAQPLTEIREVSVTDDGFSFVHVAKSYDTPQYVKHRYRFQELSGLTAQVSVFNLPGYGYVTLPDGLELYWRERKDAEPLAVAIAAILYHASPQRLAEDATALESFKEGALAWRALQDTPSLPEAVRRFKAMAEDSFRNKRFDESIQAYEAGLEAYPYWPAGHFNAALLSAEMGMYGPAVAHMKRYLVLAPDAPDARAAQDRIYIWEGKFGRDQAPGAPGGSGIGRIKSNSW